MGTPAAGWIVWRQAKGLGPSIDGTVLILASPVRIPAEQGRGNVRPLR